MGEYLNLDENQIFIVKEEIESWVIVRVNKDVTGFDDWNMQDNTEKLSKEDVELNIGDNFDFRKDFFLKKLALPLIIS